MGFPTSGLFPLGFPAKSPYAFLLSLTRDAFPLQIILHDVIYQVVSGSLYRF